MRKSVLIAAVALIAVPVFLFAAGKNKKDDSVVTRLEDLPFAPGDETKGFSGPAWFRNMIQKENTYNAAETNLITFAPGSHSGYHTHGGMIVVVTGGKGYYAEKGKKTQIIRKGDIIEIPEGTPHLHGAANDSYFQQMVIYNKDYPVNSAGQVTDKEYKALKKEDFKGRTIKEGNAYMFQKADKPYKSGLFNGDVFLTTLLTRDNAAGAPAMNFVLFPTGIYNSYHTHGGGQILIATDGIGYHQIEGEGVQVLHPGDVAFCPPGVKHWHGGSLAGDFAHIAVETNPESGEFQVFERISEEEYKALPKE